MRFDIPIIRLPENPVQPLEDHIFIYSLLHDAPPHSGLVGVSIPPSNLFSLLRVKWLREYML